MPFQVGEIISCSFEFEVVVSLISNLNLTAAYAHNDARATKTTTPMSASDPSTPPHLASVWTYGSFKIGR
jgi:iron complex outermembrane receptor protein